MTREQVRAQKISAEGSGREEMAYVMPESASISELKTAVTQIRNAV